MTQTDTVVTFTREEIIDEIDRGARRALGISAADFVRAFRERRLQDRDRAAVIDLVVLMNLLREDDPLFDLG
jgi:hypothetical protein